MQIQKNSLTLVLVLVLSVAFFTLTLALLPKLQTTTNDENTDAQEETVEETVKTVPTEILIQGSGDAAKTGDTVSVNYRGTLLDGSEFDNSYDRGEPFEFTLGDGQVIEGWDVGVVGMQVGEKRKLTIPYDMAYGEAGSPPVIPAKADLIFEIELLEIK